MNKEKMAELSILGNEHYIIVKMKTGKHVKR
jgi:hypothetical protein